MPSSANAIDPTSLASPPVMASSTISVNPTSFPSLRIRPRVPPGDLTSLYTLEELQAVVSTYPSPAGSFVPPVAPPRLANSSSGPGLHSSNLMGVAEDSEGLHLPVYRQEQTSQVAANMTESVGKGGTRADRKARDAPTTNETGSGSPSFITLVGEQGHVVDTFGDGRGAHMGVDAEGQVISIEIGSDATTDDIVLLDEPSSPNLGSPTSVMASPSTVASPSETVNTSAPPSPPNSVTPEEQESVPDAPFLIHMHFPANMTQIVRSPPCHALGHLLTNFYVEEDDIRCTWWIPHAPILAVEFFTDNSMWAFVEDMHVLQANGIRTYVVLDV